MLTVSNKQVIEPKDWANLTTKTHLGAIYQKEPYYVSKMIESVYQVELGNSLVSYCKQIGAVTTVKSTDSYFWKLKGDDDRDVRLVEARLSPRGSAITATDIVGVNNSVFYLVFENDYFGHSHIIVGNRADRYQIRLQGNGESDGSGNYIYKATYITNDEYTGIPWEELRPNTRFSVLGAAESSTLSTRGFNVHHSSPFDMQGSMTFMRQEFDVPGDMINEGKNTPLAWKWDIGNGQTTSAWINKLDYDASIQFEKTMHSHAYWGQSNVLQDGTVKLKGDSGYEVRIGSGLIDQIDPSNKYYYSDFDLDVFMDFLLYHLSVAKLSEDSRKFVCFTGTEGMKLFSRAVEKTGNGVPLEYNRITGAKAPKFERKQWTMYADIQGVEIEVVYFPDYDDPKRHRLQSNTGGTAMSKRFTILDFGTEEGEPNIQLVKPEGFDSIYKFIPGLRDPYSPAGKAGSPHPVAMTTDGYKVMRADYLGVKVKNPTRTAEFIPSELQ